MLQLLVGFTLNPCAILMTKRLLVVQLEGETSRSWSSKHTRAGCDLLSGYQRVDELCLAMLGHCVKYFHDPAPPLRVLTGSLSLYPAYDYGTCVV